MNPFVLIVGGITAAGLLARRLADSNRVAARAARRRATSIREAQDGRLVKIVGAVRLAADPLLAPIGGQRCAYFRTAVTEEREFGFAVRDEGAQDFFVVEENSQALVRSARLRVALYGRSALPPSGQAKTRPTG